MKKYFNWLTLVFILLFSFIFFIIYTVFFQKNLISQLIFDNYYEEEMKYQNVINERNNANSLFEKVYIKILPIGIKIFFPKKFNINNTVGSIYLIRPSNKLLDIKKNITLNYNSEDIIYNKNLKYGMYIIIIKWKYNNKKYFLEQKIKWK